MSEVEEQALVDEGAIPPDDFTGKIERIREVASWDVEVPHDLGARLRAQTEQLLLPEDILGAAAAALAAGHLVLQGPPGTGKSSLARALCRAFGCEFLPVTAHEDWSVFEVVGRQELRVDSDGAEAIVPVDGFFTTAVVRCAGAISRHFDNPEEPQAVWLFIDELNRAHLDKAFGELFTVLGTDELVSITLPHQPDGNRELVLPKRFRIIATLNSFDRQFVNALSQGLRRRFTFINVDIPPKRPAGESWNAEGSDSSVAVREFRIVAERAKERIRGRLESLEDPEGSLELLEHLINASLEARSKLFDLVEQVRYAGPESAAPFLPAGTAQLIDVVELFLSRAHNEAADDSRLLDLMDWATAVKLAPLFEAETVNQSQLLAFAEGLDAPFSHALRRELLQIVAAGLYYVE